MPPEFTLLTRAGCGLCANMRAELHALAGGRSYRCHIQDVDDEDSTRETWGLRVPVLICGRRVVCEGRFDPARAEQEFGTG